MTPTIPAKGNVNPKPKIKVIGKTVLMLEGPRTDRHYQTYYLASQSIMSLKGSPSQSDVVGDVAHNATMQRRVKRKKVKWVVTRGSRNQVSLLDRESFCCPTGVHTYQPVVMT